MKRIILLTLLVMAGSMIIWSQVPQAMNYKAIAKDDWGVSLPNKTITLRFSILQGSGTGSIVYQETHTTTTNKFGLMDVKIGLGKPEGVSFTSIDWSTGVYYIRIEMDPKGGTDFRLEDPAHQLLSVPYALFAESSGNDFSGNYSDLIGVPILADVATTGNYNDLFDRPTLFSGDYNDLTSKPSLFSGSYEDLFNKPTLFDGTWSSLTGKPSFAPVAFSGIWNDLINTPTTLAGYGITDALSNSHPTNVITEIDITNWNSAFSWGNHAGLYRPIGYVPVWTEITSKPTTLTGYGITDAMSTSHATNGITATDITNWNTAFNWGNHSGLYRPISYVPAWSEIIDKPTFATVATSGNYNDLADKPTIDGSETKVTEGTNVTITGLGTEASPYVISSTVGSSGSSHYIGEHYGGGVIFWLDVTGQHGLIVSKDDLVARPWCFYIRDYNAVKDGINGGHTNTERIIRLDEPSAAQDCSNYTGGNYADWYLPSKYELNLIYLCEDWGRFENKYYWSSTEISWNEAWAQNLDSGSQETFWKNTEMCFLRCVRAF